MQYKGHNIIVIGTSAGGMEALSQLLAPLPKDLPAAIFIVQHLGADSSTDFLVHRLAKKTKLACVVADSNTPITNGAVYMAPADHHLLLSKDNILVARGPRENQFRPAIDPLFRSAAAFHGSHVIGIILTGFLNDGLVGMDAVRRSDGITVVQEPTDAEYPDLPRNILRHIAADHIVPVSEMGDLLPKLVQQQSLDSVTVPPDIIMEAKIAQRIMINSENADISELDKLGKRVPYSCPDCGGALWELSQQGSVPRFRCHTGHAYTEETLLKGMNNALEETLWVAMRNLEERRSMLMNMANQDNGRGNTIWANTQRERAEEMKMHIERLRRILETATISDAEHRREVS